MTKRQCWQYKCDFCGKRGLSGGHMSNHEKHCTANPDRICRMHKHVDGPQRPVFELRRVLNPNLLDYGMGELREATGGCPMCMLAAIRASGIEKWDGDPESAPAINLNFNFKKELESFWNTINDAKQLEQDLREEYYSY